MEDVQARIVRLQEEVKKPLTTKPWQGYEPKDRNPKRKRAHCEMCGMQLSEFVIPGVKQYCHECREARRYVDAHNTQRPRPKTNHGAIIRTQIDYEGRYYD